MLIFAKDRQSNTRTLTDVVASVELKDEITRAQLFMYNYTQKSEGRGLRLKTWSKKFPQKIRYD